jgi:hypothetical protein
MVLPLLLLLLLPVRRWENTVLLPARTGTRIRLRLPRAPRIRVIPMPLAMPAMSMMRIHLGVRARRRRVCVRAVPVGVRLVIPVWRRRGEVLLLGHVRIRVGVRGRGVGVQLLRLLRGGAGLEVRRRSRVRGGIVGWDGDGYAPAPVIHTASAATARRTATAGARARRRRLVERGVLERGGRGARVARG